MGLFCCGCGGEGARSVCTEGVVRLLVTRCNLAPWKLVMWGIGVFVSHEMEPRAMEDFFWGCGGLALL